MERAAPDIESNRRFRSYLALCCATHDVCLTFAQLRASYVLQQCCIECSKKKHSLSIIHSSLINAYRCYPGATTKSKWKPQVKRNHQRSKIGSWNSSVAIKSSYCAALRSRRGVVARLRIRKRTKHICLGWLAEQADTSSRRRCGCRRHHTTTARNDSKVFKFKHLTNPGLIE